VRPLVRTALIAPQVVKALQPFLPCSFRGHRVAEYVQLYRTIIDYGVVGSELKEAKLRVRCLQQFRQPQGGEEHRAGQHHAADTNVGATSRN